MKINPILRNECKLTVRTWKFPLLVLIYTVLISLIGTFVYSQLINDSFYKGMSLSTPIILYIILVFGQCFLLMFIVPSMTSTLISSEREKQTLEVLLSSKISTLQIVLGKLFSVVSKMIILIFLSLPVYGITFLIGGIKLQYLFYLSIFLIVSTIFIGAIGIFFSTIIKSSKGATAATYGAVLFIIVGIIIIASVIYYSNLERNMMQGIKTVFPFFAILSPISGLISLLSKQVGLYVLTSSGVPIVSAISTMNNFHNVMVMSIIIQLAIAVILILLSAYFLNPLRKRRRA